MKPFLIAIFAASAAAAPTGRDGWQDSLPPGYNPPTWEDYPPGWPWTGTNRPPPSTNIPQPGNGQCYWPFAVVEPPTPSATDSSDGTPTVTAPGFAGAAEATTATTRPGGSYDDLLPPGFPDVPPGWPWTGTNAPPSCPPYWYGRLAAPTTPTPAAADTTTVPIAVTTPTPTGGA